VSPGKPSPRGRYDQPRCERQRHWNLLIEQIRTAGVAGPLVSDAYIAALAIEHACELITTDADFARFPDLRWRHPLAQR
jgi:predicted nucleic acid-binding protein